MSARPLYTRATYVLKYQIDIIILMTSFRENWEKFCVTKHTYGENFESVLKSLS